MAFRTLLAALFVVLSVAAAPAQTVDDILKRGSINVGLLTDLPPFGYLDDKREPIGYDVDVATLLGKYMGVAVNLVQVTGPNRIPFLLTNKVDILVATFGITPERAKQVAFSIPYSDLENVILAPKSRTIASIEDLKGLRIGVPRAGSQDLILTQALGSAARIMRFDDDATTFQSVVSGQTDAVADTGVVADQVIAVNPAAQLEKKFVLFRQYQGITLRTNQDNLRQWLNTFVYYIKNNGELDAIHRKWLKSPLPAMPTF